MWALCSDSQRSNASLLNMLQFFIISYTLHKEPHTAKLFLNCTLVCDGLLIIVDVVIIFNVMNFFLENHD